jgi:hypothetical protein
MLLEQNKVHSSIVETTVLFNVIGTHPSGKDIADPS